MISLDPNLTTFLIQIAATIALFIVAKIFFTKPMKAFMDKRHAFVQGQFDEAETAKNEAEQLQKASRLELMTAKDNANQIVEAAKGEADVKQEAILEQARVDAEAEMRRAQEDIKRERQNMLETTKKEIAEIATSATEKLIKKEIDEQVHADLFAEFVGLVGGSNE
ncbi:MAG: F0F1 ATP synthase subunit B [Turicibacter sp.]|nr:F0F1 ATP synthase subunit B [Turicibacter sp.]